MMSRRSKRNKRRRRGRRRRRRRRARIQRRRDLTGSLNGINYYTSSSPWFPPSPRFPASLTLSLSLSEDGCHPAVSRRVCGPPCRHKDSYLTREGPPRASPQLRLQTGPLSPERDGIRAILVHLGRQRRRRRQPRTKLRHSLTLPLPPALLRPAHTRVHQVRFPSLSRRRRSEPPAVSEQSKRDSRSVGRREEGKREKDMEEGETRVEGSSWRERKSESERTKERGWCPRQTGSHEEILHTQRLSVSIFEERENTRRRTRAKSEREERPSGMESGISPVLVEVAATK